MTQVSPANSSATRPPRRDWPFLVFLFRLLLLVVGGGFAGLLGIAIAHRYPAPNPEMPFVEQAWRRSSGWVTRVKRLPKTWRQPQAVAPVITTLVTPSPVAISPLPSLDPAQKQQFQAELTQLQTNLQTLRDRTTALESQLGGDRSDQAIDTRLAILDQQLSGEPTTASPAPPSDVNASTQATAEPITPVADSDPLTVTLPSDGLFVRNQSVLQPSARTLLDSVATDLRNYPRAAIQIAGHTDNGQPAPAAQDLSFQQAQVVQQYLASSLGNQYHWVVVGYGKTYPLVGNAAEGDRQRNRRIEIAIDPR